MTTEQIWVGLILGSEFSLWIWSLFSFWLKRKSCVGPVSHVQRKIESSPDLSKSKYQNKIFVFSTGRDKIEPDQLCSWQDVNYKCWTLVISLLLTHHPLLPLSYLSTEQHFFASFHQQISLIGTPRYIFCKLERA